MGTTKINTTIVDGYVGLLDNLSASNKLDLIKKLTESVKTDLKNKKSTFKKAFGAFDSKNQQKKSLKKSVLAEFPQEKLNHFEKVFN